MKETSKEKFQIYIFTEKKIAKETNYRTTEYVVNIR